MNDPQTTPSLADASCPPATWREMIELACLCEAAAPKPGNVHPGASFGDLRYTDFVAAATAAAGPLSRAAVTGVGTAILETVRATRAVTGTNVNLGIALLIAPVVAADGDLSRVPDVLAGLTPDDAAAVYEAIRLASAGGLSTTEEMDVAGPPPRDLLLAMRSAAGRDEIARLYATGFAALRTDVASLRSRLEAAATAGDARETAGGAIVSFFVDRLSKTPDTLIARKCGPEVASEASDRAASATDPRGRAALDVWLRGDGHRRNPGTTADVVAAAHFVLLAEERLRGESGFRDWLSRWLSPPDEVPAPDLRAELWARVRCLGPGEVTSFGRLAAALGDAKAAVWVAKEIREPSGAHAGDASCGCLRVLDASARPVGAACFGDAQAASLECEGHQVEDGRVRHAAWGELPPNGPLADLKRWQTETAAVAPPAKTVRTDLVAGLDVSYPRGGPPVAACAVVDGSTGELLWRTAVEVPTNFPYISGYLAFRELPALLRVYRLASDAGVWPGLAMIDGSGVLHPRRAGVAACFSALTGEPAIGVTKKRLTGSFDEEALRRDGTAPVHVDGETLGHAVLPTTGGKPLFVSAGGGISLEDALATTQRQMTTHRVPEPIYWADRISRRGVPTESDFAT